MGSNQGKWQTSFLKRFQGVCFVPCLIYIGCLADDFEFICDHLTLGIYSSVKGRELRFDHLNRCYKLGEVEHLFCVDNSWLDNITCAYPGYGDENISTGGCHLEFQRIVDYHGRCFEIEYPMPPANFLPFPPWRPPQAEPHGCGKKYYPCEDYIEQQERLLDINLPDDTERPKPKSVPTGSCTSLGPKECLAAKNCIPLIGARFDLERINRSDNFEVFGCSEARDCGGDLVVAKANDRSCWTFYKNCQPPGVIVHDFFIAQKGGWQKLPDYMQDCKPYNIYISGLLTYTEMEYDPSRSTYNVRHYSGYLNDLFDE